MTSNSRTARCGPACRVVWQGRSQQAAPYADQARAKRLGGGTGLLQICSVEAAARTALVMAKGSSPALIDVLAGRIDFIFDPITSSLPFVRDGKLRAIAMTAAQRSTLLPSVPTLRELGYLDHEVNPWFGLVAPAGTPPAIMRQIKLAFVQALREPAVSQRLTEQGIRAIGSESIEFAAFMRAETERWKPIMLSSGARPE